MVKIIGGSRPSLLGDCVCSLPFLTYLEKTYPESIKIGFLDLKCIQLAPLLHNQQYLDGIRISERSDQMTEKDEEYFKKFDIAFSPFPTITEENYYNKRGVVEETFKMSTLWNDENWGRIMPEEWNKLTEEERFPRLNQWFEVKTNNNYIALWASSGYDKNPVNQKRNPSKEYWAGLVNRLIKDGYNVAQLGTQNHDLISGEVLDLRHYSLFEAVRFSLGCTSVGLDSGSMWCVAALGGNQVLLTTLWRENHVTNPSALVPVNWKNRAINLFNLEINNIQYDDVVKSIKLLNE